jgi:hypothetical protein
MRTINVGKGIKLSVIDENQDAALDAIGRSLEHLEDFMRAIKHADADAVGEDAVQVEALCTYLYREAARLRAIATRVCGEPMTLKQAMDVDED